MAIPLIISVDDHVVEPPTLWMDRLPAKYREVGPRVRRTRGRQVFEAGHHRLIEEEGPDAVDVDVWLYEDLVKPMTRGYSYAGYDGEDAEDAVSYDNIRPGCFQPGPRVEDMTANHTDVSLCFPTVPRFCGQTFLEASDKELALLCVKAYNDWMIEEWCGGEARGHLIPNTLIPLWDAELAAAEIRRCADLGSHSVCFSEAPPELGLPSVYSGYWDPFVAACEETDTVINMHIGSSSTSPTTSVDAPLSTLVNLLWQNAMHAFVDWLQCGLLVRYPNVRIALSEGQVGWMPFVLERMDYVWRNAYAYGEVGMLPEPPSTYARGRIYGCIFDDVTGLVNREHIGMGQIMFETDYPHTDGTYPNSMATAERLIKAGGLDDREALAFLRGNAIDCYGLDKYFGVELGTA